MRALAIDRDVIVVVSAIWQTTCTAIRAGDEGFLVDSPILPEELEALPSLTAQAGFPVSGLLATHGDWDHLLGRLAFPEATLGVGQPTAERLAAEPGAAQRQLRAFDDEHYLDGRPPLALAGVQALPVPGHLALGDGGAELELHPAPGHTGDGMLVWLPWCSVLVCGDYLSPVEIPMIGEQGSASAYASTLAALAPFAERAATVVPGHGRPLSGEDAKRVLGEDVAYVEALLKGEDAALPERRRSAEQRRIHARNLAALG